MIDIQESLKQFLVLYADGRYASQIASNAASGNHRVEINFTDLLDYDADIAHDLLTKPEYLAELHNACRDAAVIHLPEDYPRVYASIVNLPQSHTIPLRRLGFENLGQLIQVRGVVLRASPVEQVLTETVFKCLGEGCNYMDHRVQNQRWIVKPDACPLCGGRHWGLVTRLCRYGKRQTLNLFESWDDGGRDSPQGVKVFLWGDLVNSVSPGDRVQLVGVPDVREVDKADPEMGMELYVTANSVQSTNREDEGNHFTETEVAEFKSMTTNPSFLADLSSCISTSIHGNETVKRAIALQLVGGVEKRIGGDKKRAEIHILLSGDAGTGKTTLIRAAAQLSPRGIFTTGMGSTRAGLTASVSKDKDEGWVLDAGAMVLASNGLMAVDEFDKMRPEDRGAMHTAMESGVVPINKAGINTVLNAKTSVLAACNPKLGKYNTSETLLKNLSDFPETLLSRFDAIFIFLDEGDKKQDLERARYVDSTMRNPDSASAKFSDKWMRRFIAYAKTIRPTIPKGVGDRIVQYYVDMRQAGRESGNVTSITQRQQEALYRFTEASAKIHLRPEATLEDAENAIEVISFGLAQVGVDPATGKPDINALYSGTPTSVGEKLRMLPAIVRKMEAEGDACYMAALVDQIAALWGIKQGEGEKLVNAALREGLLFRPREGVIKVT